MVSPVIITFSQQCISNRMLFLRAEQD